MPRSKPEILKYPTPLPVLYLDIKIATLGKTPRLVNHLLNLPYLTHSTTPKKLFWEVIMAQFDHFNWLCLTEPMAHPVEHGLLHRKRRHIE
jgi:hypothetical protein